MRILGFFLVLVLALASCEEKEPELPAYLLAKEEMVSIMLDMHLVETAQNLKLIDNDTTLRRYQQYYAAIFRTHETTRADFDSSLFYYTTKTDQMSVIYDKVLEELSELESQVKSDQ